MEFIGNRISFVRKEDGFSVVISAAPNHTQAYYWLVWSLLWTACGAYIFSQAGTFTSQQEKIFLIVFIGFWCYFEYKSVFTLLWKWRGREVIKIKEDGISFGRRILKNGKILHFEWRGIKDFVKVKEDKTSLGEILKTMDIFAGKNKMTLTYFGRMYAFGNDLSDDDTSELYALLRREIRKIKPD